MTACGNADRQSAAEQSGTEITQESEEVIGTEKFYQYAEEVGGLHLRGSVMYESEIFMFFYVFIMIIVLGGLIPIYTKHGKATGGVVNYDRTRRKFVYKVYMSKEEIINSLKIMNVKDELSCTFDYEKNIIIFTELSYLNPTMKSEYFYEIQEYDDFSILQLSVASIFSERNYIWLKLNPFMVSKINAEIVPFSQYGK